VDKSFNLMTLGGLAAAVGLVIDDAIACNSETSCATRRGASRAFRAIQSALKEITVPIVGSTINANRRLSPAHLRHRRAPSFFRGWPSQ